MHRLNFLADEPWDEVSDDDRTRIRWFGHPFGADILGASLWEFLPGSTGGPLHMHYGVEEMFFVLAGTPTVRTPKGEEQLSPGDVVYFPEGPDGLHDFSNRRTSRFACSPSPQSDFPMLSLTQSGESHGWRLVIPSVRCLKGVTTESSLALTYLPRVSSDVFSNGTSPPVERPPAGATCIRYAAEKGSGLIRRPRDGLLGVLVRSSGCMRLPGGPLSSCRSAPARTSSRKQDRWTDVGDHAPRLVRRLRGLPVA